MHEQALIRDLIREVESVARAERATSVRSVRVRLGALSHFTPEHFREHFADASLGTLAEGAAVEAELRTDPYEPEAQGVVRESVEVLTRGGPAVGA